MSKNEKTPRVGVNLIPEISQVLVPGDPGDPNSRPVFMPFKLGLEKEGTGNFKVTHRGAGQSIISSELEVIFLLIPRETQCRCTTKQDRKTVQCFSPDREYSSKGYSCKEDCPYAEPGVPYESKIYTRPLRKTVYILFREAGTEKAFNLARYNSVLNNISSLENLKNIFHQKLNTDKKENAYPSAHVALIDATVENSAKGSVGRFGSKVKYVNALTEDAAKKVANLNAALAAYEKERLEVHTDHALEEREKLEKAGKIGARLTRPAETTHADEPDKKEEVAAASPEETAEETKATPGVKKPKGKTPAEKIPSGTADADDDPDAIIDDGEDELPF